MRGGGGGCFDICLGTRVLRHSAGGTSSEARAATTWMHVQATHPQTNSEKSKVMLLACSADHNSLEYKRAG